MLKIILHTKLLLNGIFEVVDIKLSPFVPVLKECAFIPPNPLFNTLVSFVNPDDVLFPKKLLFDIAWLELKLKLNQPFSYLTNLVWFVH